MADMTDTITPAQTGALAKLAEIPGDAGDLTERIAAIIHNVMNQYWHISPDRPRKDQLVDLSASAANQILELLSSPASRPTRDLAKLAEIPAVGSEERDFWLEAAEQHGLTAPEEHGDIWLASADIILTLMSHVRRQGQLDVLAALSSEGDQ